MLYHHDDHLISFRYKNRKLIKPGRHFAVSAEEDGTCTLIINDVFHEDAGRYMCRAVSSVGSVSTEASVRVQSKFYPSTCLFICLSVCRSVCLSVCPHFMYFDSLSYCFFPVLQKSKLWNQIQVSHAHPSLTILCS